MKTATYFLPRTDLFIVLFLYLVAAGLPVSVTGQESARYQIITVELAARGESFTGTVLEKKEEGWFPLPEGDRVSIQGEVVTTGPGGRVNIPPLPAGHCSPLLSVDILPPDNPYREATVSAPSAFAAPPVVIFPVTRTGRTAIQAVPNLLQPGRLLTITGEGFDRILEAGLRTPEGDWIALQAVAGSSLQQKYRTPPDLPEGRYCLEARGPDGAVYRAPQESICPSLEMSGPSLKKTGQKGKIRIRSNTAGTLAISGGSPQIELIPDQTMRTGQGSGDRPVLLVDVRAGEWIELPFIARRVGQYSVSAELRDPETTSGISPEGLDKEEEEALAEMYRRNKRQWGNYQGICGTALMEMCRLYPEQCEHFKKTEAAIGEWLNELDKNQSAENAQGTTEKNNRATGQTPARTGSGQDHSDAWGETRAEETDAADPIPSEDRAELEDGAVKRAFEENEVIALRILEIQLGHLGAAVSRIDGAYLITYDKEIVFDPETGRPVDYWDFNQARPLTADEWYAIYLFSLGDNPLNMLSRIVESAESLGKSFLAGLFDDMKGKGDVTRKLEIQTEHLMLLYVTASFEQGAMPQLGDHYRSAETHLTNALTAAERGDWTTALEEWQAAQSSMAWLALEVLPGAGAAAGKTGARAGRRALIEVAQDATRNLDEVAETLRKAARGEANQELARQMSRRADAVEEMAEKTRKLDRITNLGQPRPANFPVAAKDQEALEAYFGKGNVRRVGKRDPGNVLEATDPTGRKQVWVRPDYSDYKGAYESVHGPIPEELDVNVDHLQSRARAGQQGYGYVRLELVNSKVNQAWGRHMEKRTVHAGRQGFVEPAGPAPIRHIDQFQWWKLQGIGPASVDDWVKRLTR